MTVIEIPDSQAAALKAKAAAQGLTLEAWLKQLAGSPEEPKSAKGPLQEAADILVRSEGTANLKERLKAGALANARLNLELAEEWFPVEQEAWQRLEHEEQATGKTTRGAAKSTLRRSTRHSAMRSKKPGRR